MIRPLECFIGFRYLRSGRGRGLVSFMSLASLVGIALGVAAIIVILSAMNGLEAESRARLLGMAEHVTVRPGDNGGADLDSLGERLRAVEGVVDVTPYVAFEALLTSRLGEMRPVVVRGVDPASERADSDLADIVGPDLLASLVPGSNRIVLGRFVAAAIDVETGDTVETWLPEVDAGRIVGVRQGVFTFGGAFDAGVETYDAGLALTHVADAGRIIGLADGPEALAIRLADPMSVDTAEQSLRNAAGPGFEWSNWATENLALFRAMRIEKMMMTILMLFIVAVAAFNIVTSLMMTVNERGRDIAILRTLGLEPGRVTRIFLVQGAAIGLAGTLAGVAAGLALALNLGTILPWAERTFGFQIMPGDVFYVTAVPFEIQPFDLVLIPSFAFAIALLATVFPSRRAARIEPAEVLRYE